MLSPPARVLIWTRFLLPFLSCVQSIPYPVFQIPAAPSLKLQPTFVPQPDRVQNSSASRQSFRSQAAAVPQYSPPPPAHHSSLLFSPRTLLLHLHLLITFRSTPPQHPHDTIAASVVSPQRTIAACCEDYCLLVKVTALRYVACRPCLATSVCHLSTKGGLTMTSCVYSLDLFSSTLVVASHQS